MLAFLGNEVSGSVECQLVTKGAQPGNRCTGNGGDMIDLTEAFARRRVGQVHLNNRHRAGGQSVSDGDRGVGVAGRVQDERRTVPAGFLDPVDKLAFMIGLAENKAAGPGLPGQARFNIGQRLPAIDFRLARAQEVEIGAAKDKYRLGHVFASCAVTRAKASPATTGEAMKILLNGETRNVPEGMNLAQLAAQISDDPRGIAIERNLEIVPKSEHAETVLQEGDRLEIVQFVGGG